MADDELEPGDRQPLAVGQLAHVIGLGDGRVRHAHDRRARRQPEPGPRIGQLLAVVGVDVGRYVAAWQIGSTENV